MRPAQLPMTPERVFGLLDAHASGTREAGA
jgi:hypothetical protein